MENYDEFCRNQKNIVRSNIQRLLNEKNIHSFHQLDKQQYVLHLKKLNKIKDEKKLSTIPIEEEPYLSRNSLHKLGREDLNPTLDTLLKFSYLFDIEISQLFKEEI